MTVVDKVRKAFCTGCTACMASCPVNAISMKEDEEGFRYPAIDYEKCVDCSVCVSTCTALKEVWRNSDTPDCYAAKALDDKLRIKSSSGGIFSLLAEEVLQENGVVVGAAYTDDFYGVHHIIAENSNELEKLRGAKYVQSDLENTLRKVKELLEAKRKVLFSGTPCQVEALYSYLKKDYDGLTTVDLICHGVPSSGMFNTYAKEMEEKYGSPLSLVNMRDKTQGYWGLNTRVCFENGMEELAKNDDCTWKIAFLKHLSLRPACYQCKYCSTNRFGDITLGDFWGIGKIDQSLFDKNGNSMVLVNTPQGEMLWKKIFAKIVTCPAPLDIPKTNSANLNNNPPGLHNARGRFFMEWKKKNSFIEAVRKTNEQKANVGILGWWYYENYGAALTAYGLKKAVESLGYTTILIDEPAAKHGSAESQNSKVRNFAKRYSESIQVKKRSDLVALNDQFDIFISGSDQMWNPDLKWISGWEYYLDFVAHNKKKISYASSFGDIASYHASAEDTERVRYLMNRFDAVSVREDVGKKILEETFGIDAAHVVDPVFFLKKDDYADLKSVNFKKPEKPYLLAYLGSGSEKARMIIEDIAKIKGLDIRVIFDASPDRWDQNKDALGLSDEHILTNVEVTDFVHYMKHASYVVTDTFHGTCFSIIFEQPFAALLSRNAHYRQLSLLKMLGLQKRTISIDEQVSKRNDLLEPVNYSTTNAILQSLTDISFDWLERALKMPPKTGKSPDCDVSLYAENLRLLEKIWDLEWEVNQLSQKVKKLEEASGKAE